MQNFNSKQQVLQKTRNGWNQHSYISFWHSITFTLSWIYAFFNYYLSTDKPTPSRTLFPFQQHVIDGSMPQRPQTSENYHEIKTIERFSKSLLSFIKKHKDTFIYFESSHAKLYIKVAFSWSTECNDHVEHILLKGTTIMEVKLQWRTFFDTAQEIVHNSKKQASQSLHRS